LRIIAASGVTLWQSPKAKESREYEAKQLKERRAPKRVARDLEGS
jgi:hypothetical protein